jgi:hypothetical protein
MEGSMPTPEAVADALAVIEMGGNPHRLAAACRLVAERHQGEAKRRLTDAAAAMTWAAQMLGVLDGPQTDGEARAEG